MRKGIIDPMKVTLILRAAVIAWAVLALPASAWCTAPDFLDR